MNFDQLRYFDEAASRGSFTAAAKALFITKNGLTYQIRQLERELGHDLFERDSHHLSLTAFGARLLPTAISIVNQWDKAVVDAEADEGALATPLRVGMQRYMDPVIVGAIDAAYREAFPHSSVDPHFMLPFDPSFFIESLLDGMLDVAFLAYKEIGSAGLADFIPLCDANYGAYVSPDHRLSHVGGTIDWADLGGETIVLLAGLQNPENKVHLESTMALFRQQCPTARVRFVNDLESVKYLVSHCGCVGILQYTCVDCIDLSRYVLVPFKDTETFGIASMHGDTDPRVRNYVDACVRAFRTDRNVNPNSTG